LWLSARFRPPFDTARDPAAVRVRGGAADALFVLTRPAGRRGSLAVGGGLGADYRSAGLVAPPGTAVVDASTDRELVLLIRTALRFQLELGPRLEAFAAFTADLMPLQSRFLAGEGPGARVVFSPWPVRPGVL